MDYFVTKENYTNRGHWARARHVSEVNNCFLKTFINTFIEPDTIYIPKYSEKIIENNMLMSKVRSHFFRSRACI